MNEDNSYYADDICIVGIGCVLSEANNPAAFWRNIVAGHCSIREMPAARFDSELYLDRTGEAEDKAYSNWAGFVENEKMEKSGAKTRMSALALEATRQALDCLPAGWFDTVKHRADIFLGCMGIDETFLQEKMYRRHKKPFEQYVTASNLASETKKKILAAVKKNLCPSEPEEEELVASIFVNYTIASIREKFGLSGRGCMVDAACASSLAALDAAVAALQNYETDMAIAGGVEANLGPDTFVLFGKVGALSKGVCQPFDASTDGLSQGEGAVVFVLQRLADARRDQNRIYGVIRAIGASSDGRSSSLFSPSSVGQLLALERAYVGLEKLSVDYLECHGTGTKVGDKTEMESLNKFFPNGHVPAGSVKALIGHTKGAAGAAGVLKCILSLENGIIPASGYIRNSIAPADGTVYVNKENIQMTDKGNCPHRCGISAFGFGNINYHIVLDEFKAKLPIVERKKAADRGDEIAIIGRGEARLDEIDVAALSRKFKLMPRSIPQTDKAQLAALLAVEQAFSNMDIGSENLEKEKVAVISASVTYLDAAFNFLDRIRYADLKKALTFLDDEVLAVMLKYKDRFPKVTEDTGPGILSNVIAGKICNVFDFKGKNFNIDADFNSVSVALEIARRELRKEKEGVIVLVFFDEQLDKEDARIKKQTASCFVISNLEYALEKNYPIEKTLKEINHHD